MNNFLVLGRRSGPDSALLYDAAEPFNHVVSCRLEDNGAWTNSSGAIDEDGLLAKSDNQEMGMVCKMTGFSHTAVVSTTEPERNCLFFKAPVAGVFKIIRKEQVSSGATVQKWFLVFTALDADCLRANVVFDVFETNVVMGNSIALSLHTPAFDSSVAGVIVRKSWVDYVLHEAQKRRPVAGPLIRVRRGERMVNQDIFSQAELMVIKRTEESRRLAAAWELSTSKFTEDIAFSTPFPLATNECLPLFSFTNPTGFASLRLELGFCEIPHSGERYLYENGWTWFDPVRMIRKMSFSPDWNIAGIPAVAETEPFVIWHAHPAVESGKIITKASNQQFLYLNPKQSNETDSEAHKSAFFLANRLLDATVESGSNSCDWAVRSLRRTSNRGPIMNVIRNPLEALSGGVTTRRQVRLTNIRYPLQIQATVHGSEQKRNILVSSHNEDDPPNLYDEFTALFGSTIEANRFENANQINDWIRRQTGYTSYLEWFERSVRNTRVRGIDYFSDRHFDNNENTRDNFVRIWENIHLMFSETRATGTKVNILQVMSLMTIMNNEATRLRPVTEGVGPDRTPSYFFQRLNQATSRTTEVDGVLRPRIKRKQSYNFISNERHRPFNSPIPAGYLFFGPTDSGLTSAQRTRYQRNHEIFMSVHGDKPFGRQDALSSVFNISPTENESRNRWNGTIYPRSPEHLTIEGFVSDISAIRTDEQMNAYWDAHQNDYFNPSTFVFNVPLSDCGIIKETDFCKFAGRGLIQTTWRYNFLSLINMLMSENSWISPEIISIRNEWNRLSVSFGSRSTEDAPFTDSDIDDIATISSFQDWEHLFPEGNYEFPCRAIYYYQKQRQNMLTSLIDTVPISRLLEAVQEAGTIFNIGRRVGSNDEYGNKFLSRVKQQMKALLIDYRRTHPSP